VEWLLIPVAYLVGSVQWGLYLVMLTKRVDLRTVGSGKTGTTNVLRTSGKAAAVVVLLADFGKGAGVTILARVLSDDPSLHAAVGVAVIVGHIWPVLASFRGGRGIATGLGTITGIDPWATLIGLSVFLPVGLGTRYISLGSITGVAAVIAAFVVRALIFDAPLAYMWFGVSGGGLIIGVHHDNIRRLLKGQERRIGQRVG
jgi:glycerol-3-phosphate acyltransferase PlsY